MVNLYATGEIIEDITTELSEINGEILKIVVFTDKIMSNVKVNIVSLDDEVLCDDYLNSQMTRFYPKNTISISQEQTHIDNYFIFGPLFLTVTGLGDGEVIKDIAVYYK